MHPIKYDLGRLGYFRLILAPLVAGFALLLAGAGSAHAENDCTPRHCHQYLRIASFDGTEIAVSLFTPRGPDYPGKRPALVMPASWGVGEFQYDFKAAELADGGYIVLGYAARGFGSSGGYVDVAGPNSQHDNMVLIDWLIANTDTDPDKIGMAGVSYGAGLGLLAAANDPRIKAVVAISGWADLSRSLYDNQTVRELWLDIIVATGVITGRLEQDVFTQIDRLKSHTDIDEVLAWTKDRSAASMVDQINARQVPIFIANSYEDNLFPPAQARDFFRRLTGPKKFYLDHGIHGTSSLLGQIGLKNAIWDESRRWLDQWLAGKDTGVLREDAVSFLAANGKSYFPDFPPLGAAQTAFVLQPLNRLRTSSDQLTPSHPVVGFVAGIDSGATSGLLPVVDDVLSGVLQKPVQTMFGAIDHRFAAIYKTPVLANTAYLRGSALLHIPLEPHDGPMQMVAYLYDVNSWGLATLISYGVATRYTGTSDTSQINIDLGVTAYNVADGNHLVVAIDSIDSLYRAPTFLPYWLEISHTDNAKVVLDLPLVSLSP